LEVTWEFGGEVTWLEVGLTLEGEGTTLTLRHTAFVDPERWEQYGPGAVGVGWELLLMGLDLHLTSGGAVVDPAEFARWSTSDDGRAFVTASSVGWGDASIAGGEPEVAARAAQGRTTAFYTGVPEGDVPPETAGGTQA
jgi:hypothetical protein